MSKTTDQFRAELEAKKPFKVKLLWDDRKYEIFYREAFVTTGAMWVVWPLAGSYQVDRTGHLKGSKTTKRWRVCAEDFAELKRRFAIVRGTVAEFLPVTGSAGRTD